MRSILCGIALLADSLYIIPRFFAFVNNFFSFFVKLDVYTNVVRHLSRRNGKKTQ